MAGKSTCPMVIINASEVASVIGEHPYKSREEIMQKVWERTDQRTFCIVNATQNKTEVARIVTSRLQEADEEIKEQFSSLLVGDWDKQDDTFIRVLKEIFPEDGYPKPSLWPLRWKILKAIKNEKSQDFHEKILLKEARVEQLLIEEVKKLSKDENKPISKSVEEICEKKNIKNEEVKKALDSALTKERGTKLETKTVEVFGQEKDIKFKPVPQETVSKVMEHESVRWALQGRADALLKDKVIEVKNRKNRFMQPLYDLIQLQAYLYLYEMPEGILLERFRKEHNETSVKFEDNYWNNEVVPALKDFVFVLQDYVEKNMSLLKENKCDVNIGGPRSPSKRPCGTLESPAIQEKMARNDEEEVDSDSLFANIELDCLDNFVVEKGLEIKH
ncbi:uncharacterized protein LOC116307230 [Actinia tenebrosa]|uniref:Uncharacterized protein LOC116307230 n=1 Tax=Actinia tenebrosa TaxID=6105 RepID=A0A6P8J188_ACTTE|nr:uncharacterized protein LOC116307230 [Actinia tenebrosa]